MRASYPALFWMLTLGPVVGFAMVSPAAAQVTDAGKWEVELRGGAILATNPTGGTVALPGPGQVFTTATTMPTPPPSSRRESSWYFGDGAVLFNQAATALAQLPGQITTLDPVLGRPFATMGAGGGIGVSVSRALTPRFSAEVSVDYGLARFQIAESNRDAIEATRASFIPAFDGLIRFNPNRVLTSVTSTASLDNDRGRQLIASGALIVRLRTTGDVIPFATIGAGLVSISGTTPSAALRGNYQFRLPNGAPIDETDNVTVRDVRDDQAVAAILGGGVKYHVSPRWGIRLGVRVVLSPNPANTVVDAAPTVALGRLPAGRGVLGAEPSIQFTNNSSDPVTALGVTAVAASSLTGPEISEFRSFSGTGIVSLTNIMAGVFWRF
jgi:opacity protein-like surface antigen